MPTSRSPSNHPLSPWAERFSTPGGLGFKWDSVKHSGYAPEFPRINDPLRYLDIPNTRPDPIPPNGEDLDKLFHTEAFQTKQLRGLRTWQAVTLNRWVRFSPQIGFMSGGHLSSDAGEHAEIFARIYKSTRIKVDETRWLPFLRKNRWYDWIQTSPPAEQATGRKWSVDDPKVWEELSISLELTDRIFKALIDDKNEADYWQNAVAHVMGNEPFPGARVLLSYAVDQSISKDRGTPCQWDVISTLNKVQWRARLVQLLSTHLWSFVDFDGGTEAQDVACEGSNFSSICLLSSGRLRTLCDDQITLAERCVMHFNLAVSLVHELMHAILTARMRHDAYEGNCLSSDDTNNQPEPVGELYLSFDVAFRISRLAKGIPDSGLRRHCIFPLILLTSTAAGKAVIPLVVATYEMPNAIYQDYPLVPGNWQNRGARIKHCHFTALWISKLLSEAFWSDPAVPEKSANFFHRNSVFVSDNPNAYRGPSEWSDVQVKDLNTLPHIYVEDTKAVETWHEREQLWSSLRAGWYDDEKLKWKSSPWSWISCRRRLDEFADAYAKKDETACGIIANWMTETVDWKHDQATYLSYLPQQMDPNPAWIFHAIGTQSSSVLCYCFIPETLYHFSIPPRSSISNSETPGLLMMATLPIRDFESRKSKTNPAWTYQAVPSREADASGSMRRIQMELGGEKNSDTVRKSEFFDQLEGRGQVHGGFSQADYLQLVFDLVAHITRYALVNYSWVAEILDAYAKLLGDRQALQAAYPNSHTAQWATEWVFKVPPYDKRLGRVDPRIGGWREMTVNPGTGQWDFV
ncbi:hypothetical protein HD806DRAFT_552910 [Xylariaceae sp. AK1471]|nr:hypothetical protein HD806DRAFT_552910 [Xylariaceae sp. AK1471]